MKKSIKIVFWFYLLLFLMLIIYLIKFTLTDSKKVITNSYNPRLTQSDNTIKRGSILDCNNNVIAESIKTETGYKRIYNYPKQFSHVVGFTEQGKSGIEAKYNFQLQNLNNEVWQRIKNIINNEELRGNNLILTLNSDLQNYVYEKLGNNKGSIVIMEPSTGKILSMVSYPNFNSSTISQDWNKLNNDIKNTPLVNRATQGLYPPGSVFKIITAGAALETNRTLKDFSINCNGEITIDNSKIRCFNNTSHGRVEMVSAFKDSCNSYFAQLGTILTTSELNNTANKALFNSSYDFSLEYNKSSFVLDKKASTDQIMQTAIGQGKTLITPLHCTMITSAVANNGIMMKPYILDYVQTYNGKIKNKSVPKMQAQIFSTQTTQDLKSMMEDVVVSGTGVQAKIKGINVAGKTGTAETGNGKDHAWFTAFAPVENPQIAITVILEEAGRGSKAVPIARDILDYYLNQF